MLNQKRGEVGDPFNARRRDKRENLAKRKLRSKRNYSNKNTLRRRR